MDGLQGRQASQRSYGSPDGHGRASSSINADIIGPSQPPGNLVPAKTVGLGAKAGQQLFQEAGTSSDKKKRDQNATAEFFARGLQPTAGASNIQKYSSQHQVQKLTKDNETIENMRKSKNNREPTEQDNQQLSKS